MDENDESDELLVIEDGAAERSASPVMPPWRIMVVDDDPAVHRGTHYALRDFSFENRPIHIVSAYSAEEATRLLLKEGNVAVILLDVVMETDDAGLRFARWVREELGDHNTRIVLRTGQPGQAPERSVMADFDLNDYRAKTGLNDDHLFTSITAALRSYDQIASLAAHRQALELIIETSELVLDDPSIGRFHRVMLEKLGQLLDLPSGGGIVELAAGDKIETARLVEGTLPLGARTLGESDPHLLPLVRQALAGNGLVSAAEVSLVAVHCADAPSLVAIYPGTAPQGSHRRITLAAFCGKLALAYRNVHLVAALSATNDALERRVQERTAALAAVNRELQVMASIDALTGLLNRRAFLEAGAAELKRADRSGSWPAVLIMDLDHFKIVNDTWGHAAGDAVLHHFAGFLRQELRDIDLVGRLGGEEFGAVLPETGAAGALGLAERIRAAIAVAPVAVDGAPIPMTTSIGIALGAPGESLSATIARADRALYRAKFDGRNRISLDEARQ